MERKFKKFIFFILLINVLYCLYGDNYIIKGGTIINTEGNKVYTNNSIIVIEKNKIIYTGKKNHFQINKKYKIIDAAGKYIVPGLIDSFATINNQNYANAYLYCGVTSIIGVFGGRRGKMFDKGSPSPNIYKLEGVGENRISTKELITKINELYNKGYRVLLLMYKLKPEQVKTAIKIAHKLGMGVIGELGYTHYIDALNFGIDAFVHTTRYSLNFAPEKMIKSVAENPFSDNLNSDKWRYYKWLTKVNLNNTKIKRYIKIMGEKRATLIPTFGLLYLDLPNHKNPWKEKIASILNPKDINNPADMITGEHTYDKEHLKAYRELALKEFEIEKKFKKAGVRYLAGSGTDVWGSMPGIFLHYELQALKKIGLTNREVLAAATSNFSNVFGFNVGKIKKGFIADILILKKNPLINLTNLRNIDILIHNGIVIKRKELLKRGDK